MNVQIYLFMLCFQGDLLSQLIDGICEGINFPFSSIKCTGVILLGHIAIAHLILSDTDKLFPIVPVHFSVSLAV